MGRAILKACPICGKIPVEKYRPFCSARCADIDLGGWLGEKYRVPGQTAENRDQGSDEDEQEQG